MKKYTIYITNWENGICFYCKTMLKALKNNNIFIAGMDLNNKGTVLFKSKIDFITEEKGNWEYVDGKWTNIER